ncbi:MAG: DNA repair protein RadC [Alphaproteobacteria bacterium]|nr:DNA repair protein RadC [Alphaproteobacteria bacterium]
MNKVFKFNNCGSVNFCLGHRQRLKKKFLLSPKSFLDYEILEMLLFGIFSRKDTKTIAKNLIQEFGTLKAVIFASEQEIKKIPGLGESTAIFFKLLKETFARLSLQPLKEEPIIASNIHVIEYYRNLLSLERKEQFRVMFINNKNKLIAEEQLQQGTVDQTPIYPREVIQRALEHGASAIILVHNHPSGSPYPSKEDIIATKNLSSVVQRINLKLLDHIIIAENSNYSFAEHNLL